MLDRIREWNRRYDKMSEPRRFLTFFIPTVIILVLSSILAAVIGQPAVFLLIPIALIAILCRLIV